MPQPQYESKKYPHRADFYKVEDLARDLCGDLCLVPDPDNLDGVTRESLTKISHWSNMTPDDVPRLAVLTDSFFRFIDEGEDASVITLWRGGTPLIQQIDGDPCEAAVDAVMDAVTNTKPLQEKWAGMPPLEREVELLAYEQRRPSGIRPKWIEREARRRLEARDIDPDAPDEPDEPRADNDNRPDEVRLREFFGAGQIGFDADTQHHFLSNCTHDGKVGVATVNNDGDLVFQAYTTQPRQPIHASPFTLRDPSTLPAREWLYGLHYIRRYLTATVGAGGGGKSAHAVSECLAMVTGRPLLDPDGPLTTPLRVWYINAEDPQDEIDRRFHAAAKHFGVDASQIGDRLYTDSGRDQEFVVMKADGRNFTVAQPVVDELVTEIRLRQIDVVIVDPFVSTHEVPENDNTSIQRVAKAWTEVADRANCCVEVVHHVVKNGGEVTADSARGGSALKDKTRSMRVLNPMTEAEAEKTGIDEPERYFRIDLGKFNMTAKGHSSWRRFVSVPLGNGHGVFKRGDEIGVVEPWRWPSKDDLAERAAEVRRAVVADVPDEHLEGLKARLGAGSYKADQKGKPWAGDVLVETGIAPDRETAKAMLVAWIELGELEVVELYDQTARKPRNFVKPAGAPT